MFGRGFLFIGIIVAAFLVPYVLTSENGSSLKPTARWWDSMWSDSLDERDPIASASPLPDYTGLPDELPGQFDPPRVPRGPNGVPQATPWVPVTPLPGGGNAVPPRPTAATSRTVAEPVYQLGQFLQFSVTPAWVMQQWPAVSTTVESNLSAWRVALVSGTGLQDLAGSLTYYFDGQQQVRRIAFDGTTGDPSQLINFVTTQYLLAQYAALGGALYLRQQGDRTTDALRIKLSPPLSRAQPLRMYDIKLELNRPGEGVQLSENFRLLLEQDRRMLIPPSAE